jgi:hypothetical protein
LFGLDDPGLQVVADLLQSWALGWVGSEHGASDTDVFMNARGIESACAGANRQFATLELRKESIPFVVGWGSVFFARVCGSTAGDERPVRFKRLRRIDGLVAPDLRKQLRETPIEVVFS